MADALRLAGGLVLLTGLTLAVLYIAQIPHLRGVVEAAVRAVAQLALVALALRGVFAAPLAVIAVLAVMFGVAAWTARSRLPGMAGRGRAVVLGCGAGSIVVVGLIVGLPILDRNVRDLVAVSGIVIGGTMTAASLTGRRLAEGLRLRREEIEGWIALGATNRQAVRDIARTAAYEAMVPVLDQTRTVGLVTLPGAFVGALLGGASVVSAAKFQVVVLVGLMCAEAISAATVAYVLGAPLTLADPAG